VVARVLTRRRSLEREKKPTSAGYRRAQPEEGGRLGSGEGG
jgi:hypothetical protein